MLFRSEETLSFVFFFFFFKQKTAYEMQFGDWSSDVCSSDLRHPHFLPLRIVFVGKMMGKQAGIGNMVFVSSI